MAWWSGIPKTFVEATTAKASEVNENFQAVKEALLYLLSEENHSPFPQLSGEPAKRILTIAQNLTLLNSSGESDFLRLTSTAERKISGGTANVSSGSSSGFSLIEHSLGKVPIVVVANDAQGTFQVNCSTSNWLAGNFKLWAYRTDGAALGTVKVAWVAIG